MSLFATLYDPMMRGAEDACLRDWRRELLHDVDGDVLEVGAGTGANVALYPPAVRGLVVGGTVDIVKLEIFEQTPELLGPGSESLIVGGAGHWPHREGEDDFIAALLSFLGRL